MSVLEKYINLVEAQSGMVVASHLRNTVGDIAKDCLDNFDYTGKKMVYCWATFNPEKLEILLV